MCVCVCVSVCVSLCAAFPFAKSPEQHPTFRLYYSKEWLDTFQITLHNFFSTLFTSIHILLLLLLAHLHNYAVQYVRVFYLYHSIVHENRVLAFLVNVYAFLSLRVYIMQSVVLSLTLLLHLSLLC